MISGGTLSAAVGATVVGDKSGEKSIPLHILELDVSPPIPAAAGGNVDALTDESILGMKGVIAVVGIL